MDYVSLVGTLMTQPSPSSAELSSLPDSVDWLEVRADLVGDLTSEWLRSRFSGKLLYTIRSSIEGGRFDGSPEERRTRLLEAAGHYDLIDLEGDRDLHSDVVKRIPADKRLISWSGAVADLQELSDRVEKITSTPARLYRISL
ncbi:MAG: type I 3-dehydroquinate dehydratase, partial [Terriglobia bacterium]